MRAAQELAGYLLRGESSKAKSLLSDIRQKEFCEEYAESFVQVVLREGNKRLMDELASYYISDEEFFSVLYGHDVKECTCSLVDRMCAEVKKAKEENQERIFQKAIYYIESNLECNTLFAGSVANYVGISQSSLAKLFSKMMHMSPVEYICFKRVKKSVGMILNSCREIREIATLCGFSSSESYIRAFKKLYGTTPAKFRREKE